MSTYGFNGVPAGTYKVIVRKTVVEDVKQVTDAYGEPCVYRLSTIEDWQILLPVLRQQH